MVAISWDDSYSVHVESIDAQHKKIMSLLNDLHRISITDAGDQQLEAALTSLLEYTRAHFHYEESFLEKFHFPFVKSHQEKHAGFFTAIERIKKELLNGRGKNNKKLINYMVTWLKYHIVSEDKQYVCFMLEHGIK
ncbi:bacteriohemerythrin [bacterium]|nr:bacteriohemerythrin [bacterium]